MRECKIRITYKVLSHLSDSNHPTTFGTKINIIKTDFFGSFYPKTDGMRIWIYRSVHDSGDSCMVIYGKPNSVQRALRCLFGSCVV